MIAKTWTVGADPLPIFNSRCDLLHKFAGQFLERGHLVYVDIRHASGAITIDGNGYLPHLQYTPDYQSTEADKGEYTLTGNDSKAPIWRFDPAPFFANMSGSVVLTGGTGGGTVSVTVVIKRFAKMKPLRHTLTIGTQLGRFLRPFGCSGLWLPDSRSPVTLSLGALTKTVAVPNGGFAAFGPFDTAQFTPDSLATMEVILPC